MSDSSGEAWTAEEAWTKGLAAADARLDGMGVRNRKDCVLTVPHRRGVLIFLHTGKDWLLTRDSKEPGEAKQPCLRLSNIALTSVPRVFDL